MRVIALAHIMAGTARRVLNRLGYDVAEIEKLLASGAALGAG